MGKAEAERLKLKTEAYQKSKDAAKKALVLKAPPQIASSLTKVDEIAVLSGDNSKVTSEVNGLLAGLPASVQSLSSVALSKIALIKDASCAQDFASSVIMSEIVKRLETLNVEEVIVKKESTDHAG
ncbi:Flotillin-2 [Microtus ochrogaster]|uniref:Flotillin-2 n=1 Tax=Microtus ochrogaster TaxID=79684 RepID=A0A8J6KWV3_MICOH|nr:Flotillin-2 [Microtus ochrogaster]